MFCSLVFKYNHKFNSAVWLDLEGNKGNMDETIVAHENTKRVTGDGAALPRTEGMAC